MAYVACNKNINVLYTSVTYFIPTQSFYLWLLYKAPLNYGKKKNNLKIKTEWGILSLCLFLQHLLEFIFAYLCLSSVT